MPADPKKLVSEAKAADSTIQALLSASGRHAQAVDDGLGKRTALSGISAALKELGTCLAQFDPIVKDGQKALAALKGVKAPDADQTRASLEDACKNAKTAQAQLKTRFAAATKKVAEAEVAEVAFLKLGPGAVKAGKGALQDMASFTQIVPRQMVTVDEVFDTRKFPPPEARIHMGGTVIPTVLRDLKTYGAGITTAESIASSLVDMGAKVGHLHAGPALDCAQEAASTGAALTTAVRKFRPIFADGIKRIGEATARWKALPAEAEAARKALASVVEQQTTACRNRVMQHGKNVRAFLNAYENLGLRKTVEPARILSDYRAVAAAREALGRSDIASEFISAVQDSPAGREAATIGVIDQQQLDKISQGLAMVEAEVRGWIETAKEVVTRFTTDKAKA